MLDFSHDLLYSLSTFLATYWHKKKQSEVIMKKSYGVLRVLSTIFKVVGIIIGVVAVLGGLVMLVMSFSNTDVFVSLGFDESSAPFVGLVMALFGLIGGLLTALVVYGSGELLILLIAIEDNTQRTATLLADVTEEE
jgi:hypothetical protein